MISEARLLEKVRAWAKTPNGKKRISDHIQKTLPPVMIDLAEELIAIIKGLMPKQISDIALLYDSPKKISNNCYRLSINFDPKALHRESLYSEKYDGIDNIVALFNNGYHAKNYVYGWWNPSISRNHTLPTDSFSDISDSWVWVQRGKTDREPLNFMQQAISTFNDRYGKKYGVTALLSSKYKQN